MMYIPFISRLSFLDYFRISSAFTFLIIESIIRLLFAVLPISIFLALLRKVWPPKETNEAATPVDFLQTTEDFVRYWGFPFEPHYVTTRDGYILCLHRIPHKRSSLDPVTFPKRSQNRPQYRGNAPESSASPRPVVLLWHGFLMCSEVWVCTPEPEASLAFTLAEAGYDVWLGNTRGNKYSCKHKLLKPTSEAFWDFSLDNLAMSDFPDVVDYILRIAGAPSLSYIGFSQGTAQGFSALSLSRELCKQVNLFIALAPATKPHALASRTINALVNQAPEVIYLLFGRKALISSTLFWQSVLSPPLFTFVIDKCMWLLFGWNSKHIPHKNIVYRHLYSYTAVKTVVHWFQIMKTRRFQMYDEQPAIVPGSTGGHLVPKFPTESISSPLAILYGGGDTLPDIEYILEESPTPVFCMQVDEYEHLHFLWGSLLQKTVHPAVLALLNEYSEVWSEPSTKNNDAFRTVPWISKSELENALQLGRGKASNVGTIFDGRVSVDQIISKSQIFEKNKIPFALLPSYEEVSERLQSSCEGHRSNELNNSSHDHTTNPITDILDVANRHSESNYLGDASNPTSSLRNALDNPPLDSLHEDMTASPPSTGLRNAAAKVSPIESQAICGALSSSNIKNTYHSILNDPNLNLRQKKRSLSIGGIPQSQRPYPLVKPEVISEFLADSMKIGYKLNGPDDSYIDGEGVNRTKNMRESPDQESVEEGDEDLFQEANDHH